MAPRGAFPICIAPLAKLHTFAYTTPNKEVGTTTRPSPTLSSLGRRNGLDHMKSGRRLANGRRPAATRSPVYGNPKSPPPRSRGTIFRTRERLGWAADQDFRILSIDGGGIRGILPLAFLARLEREYLDGASIATCFDLITGTSTGGIIALGLGAGKTANELLDLYMNRGGDIFPDYSWGGKVARGVLQKLLLHRCNQKKLGAMVQEILGQDQLWTSQKRLCIPSAEMRHFEPFINKTPHHPDYKMDWKKGMADIAMQTAAAPSFYPPVSGEDGYEFVDGGIWANNPIMVGVADAMACFEVTRGRMKVLSLGCVRDKFQMSWARRKLGGQFFWASLIFETMYIASQNAIGQARLILGGDKVHRVDAQPITPPLEMWDWARCRAKLPTMADDLFIDHGPAVESVFLRTPAAPYAPVYMPSNPPG